VHESIRRLEETGRSAPFGSTADEMARWARNPGSPLRPAGADQPDPTADL